MTSVLKKIATSNAGAAPELIYMPDFVAEARASSARRSRASPASRTSRPMGADGQFTPDYLKAAGKAAVGQYLSSPNFSAFAAGYQDFLDQARGQVRRQPARASSTPTPMTPRTSCSRRSSKVAVENADGSLSIPKGALRDAIYRDQGLPGPDRHADLQPHRATAARRSSPSTRSPRPNVDARKMPDKPIWPTP